MEKLIQSILLLSFLSSCNVVKLATQGETTVPDEFFVSDKLPFNANPLTMTFVKMKSYLMKLDSSVPSSTNFNRINQNFALSPYSWGSNWTTNIIQSNRTDSTVSPRKWIADHLKIIEEDKGGGDKYESVTWKILNTLNSICAIGLILGNKFELGEFDFPENGDHSAVIDAKAASGMREYCNMNNPEENIGRTIPVTISTPTNTGIYQKQIDMMGDTFYLRYDNQTMNFATIQSNDNGASFSKLIINDDQVSNGLRLEFISGPDNSTSNDNEEHLAVRYWYDSSSSGAALGKFMFMYHNFFDGSGSDSTKTFFVGGTSGTMDRMPIMMVANELYSSTEDYSYGCMNKSDWSIQADGNYCGVGSEVDGSGQTPNLSTATAYYNYSSGYNTNLSNLKAVGDNTSTGFTAPGNMQTSSF